MAIPDPIPEKMQESNRTACLQPRGKISYLLMLAGVVLLAASGIGSFLLGKSPMTQWVLMAHVSAAPLFAVGLALMALTWADRCRFGTAGQRGVFSKALFWLILVCGLVVILSGVVPMTPWFGTSGQHVLFLTHRYGGIVLALCIALHLFALRRECRRSNCES